MARIFVSYRREDSPGHSGRLYDHLVDHFGESMIFRDIEAIALGADFVKALEEAIASCGVLLAVIGPQWLDIQDKHGKRRLDNPKDFVRLEIAAALARNVRVIPVLVDNAQMPSEEELPPELAPLSRRNAFEISDLRFRPDVERLVQSIEAVLGKGHSGRQMTPPKPVKPPQVSAGPRPPVAVQKTRTSKVAWFMLIFVGLPLLGVGLLFVAALIQMAGESGSNTAPASLETQAREKTSEVQLKKLISPNGFAVMLPGDPEETPRQKVPSSNAVSMSWESSVEGVSYSVGIIDYPVNELAGMTAEEYLGRFRDGLVTELKGSLKSERPVVLAVYPGKALTVSSQTGEAQLRIYLVGSRAYLLLVMPYSSGDRFADTFLNSLELINPPPIVLPSTGGSGGEGMKN